MQCLVCQSYLGCDVDCPDAPWNHDRPRTTRMGYLMRLARCILSIIGDKSITHTHKACTELQSHPISIGVTIDFK